MTEAIEEWRPVLGFEGHYEVSDHGRVRGVDRVITRSNGHRQTILGRSLRQHADAVGRLSVDLYRPGHRRTVRVSVLVLEAFVGPRPASMEGCHNNGDNSDNRASNLRWDTRQENERDKVRLGTHYLANRKHCPREHPLIEPNLIPSLLRRGYRSCLACHRAKNRQRTAAMRGGAFDLIAAADHNFARIMQEAP